jgi:hypothetical protein
LRPSNFCKNQYPSQVDGKFQLLRFALSDETVQFGLSQYVLQYACRFIRVLATRSSSYNLAVVDVHVIPRLDVHSTFSDADAHEQAQAMRSAVWSLTNAISAFRCTNGEMTFQVHGCLLDDSELDLSVTHNSGSSEAWRITLDDHTMRSTLLWVRYMSDEIWQEKWLE